MQYKWIPNGDLPWWIDRTFEVRGKELDIYQLPIDPDKPEVLPVICKVHGVDYVLCVYQIEVVGGSFDGSRFYAGEEWLLRHIQP